MIKRKIVFTIQSLDLGGIEVSLVNLLLRLDNKKYDITIITQMANGTLLDALPAHVKVIHYHKSEHANVMIRKLYNRSKILYWSFRYKHTYDVAVAYCGYCIPSAILARNLGKKSYMWVHTDHMSYFHQDEKAYRDYFAQYKTNTMDGIVFVSKRAYTNFIHRYPILAQRCMVIKNQMQVESIREKAQAYEKTLSKYGEMVFFSVARHEEDSKRLSRILYACAHLKKEGYSFRFASIGDGVDHAMYIELVRQLNIEDVVDFYGEQMNPYPYFKAGDVFILSSEYEGDPVVAYEAMILGKNIICTDVGDMHEIIKPAIGKVVDKNEKSIYEAMKAYIEHGITEYTFDYEEINNMSIMRIEELFHA